MAKKYTYPLGVANAGFVRLRRRAQRKSRVRDREAAVDDWQERAQSCRSLCPTATRSYPHLAAHVLDKIYYQPQSFGYAPSDALNL